MRKDVSKLATRRETAEEKTDLCAKKNKLRGKQNKTNKQKHQNGE